MSVFVLVSTQCIDEIILITIDWYYVFFDFFNFLHLSDDQPVGFCGA